VLLPIYNGQCLSCLSRQKPAFGGDLLFKILLLQYDLVLIDSATPTGDAGDWLSTGSVTHTVLL
jgi:hypothetical protein